MKRAVVIGIVAVVVISAVTAAIAIAETSGYRGARAIPTVVTSSTATETISAAIQTGVGTSAEPLPAPTSSTGVAPSGGHESVAPATPQTGSPKDAPAVSPPTSNETADQHVTQHEVVTRTVRDDDGEYSSAGHGSEDAEKATTGSKETQSQEAAEKRD
jgi:hypothetical protein